MVIFKLCSTAVILALVAIVPLTHLGTMPVAQFMRRYWQRRPLLIRNALPDFETPLAASSLFALAGREEVESRLVTAFDGWRMQPGPIARRRIPPLGKPGWTLLVQGVDLHDDRAADLLARFRFIADARLDDLMISYASDDGGVGPHVDDYDVFLLQAQGRRRWRIGKGNAGDFLPGLPLKVLRRFKPEQDWVLEAGDLLYLPPGVAHEGTAVGGACLTCSIGFRAPAWREPLKGEVGFEAETVRRVPNAVHRASGSQHPRGRLRAGVFRRANPAVGEACFSDRPRQRGDVAVYMQSRRLKRLLRLRGRITGRVLHVVVRHDHLAH